VRPDISCYSKAIANGYPLAAVGAADWLRDAAEQVYATGSFWFAGVPQAAAVATIETLRESDAIGQMQRVGQLLRDGLEAQAATHGLRIKQTGPVQIPFMTFSADTNFERANAFCLAAVRRGVYFHPWHNWFLSAAHTEDDIRQTLEVSDAAFGVVREQFGEG
jgi:glutamate-1-semialdehyde 2,1-aminomutase